MTKLGNLRRTRHRILPIVGTVALLFLTLLFFLPIGWAVLMSLKTKMDIVSMPPKWIFSPTLANYKTVWGDGSFFLYAKNSLVIAGASTLIGLILGVPAGYTLARHRFKGNKWLLLGILSTRMMPPVAFVIPFFIIFTRMELRDTQLSVIIMHLTFIMGFVIWMTRSYFKDIPIELEEAAAIDGCSPLQIFMKIVLPLGAPGVATSAILAFIFSWNEFLYALVLTTVRAKTLPLGIYNWVAYEEIMWGELTATAVITLIPVVIVYSFVQKALVRGLTMGAVKG